MKDDRPIILPNSTVRGLQRLRTTWFLGWAVATLTSVIASYSFARARGYQQTFQQSTAEVEVLRQKVMAVQDEQKLVNESYIRAWENQQKTADLLVTWGTWVKDQTELKIQNRKNAPLNLVRVNQ